MSPFVATASPAQRPFSVPPRGALAETFPRFNSDEDNNVLTSQTLWLQAVPVYPGLKVSSISWSSGATGMTPGATPHVFFGLYDDDLGSISGVARALLAQSADDGASAWNAQTTKTLAMVTPYTIGRVGTPPYAYIALLVQATTVPNLAGFSGTASPSQIAPVYAGNADAAISALPNPASAPVGNGVGAYGYVS